MTTKLEKPLKREIEVERETYTLTIAPDGLKLVTIVFSTQIGGEGFDIDGRLQEIRRLLADLVEPGERCHLFVDDDATVAGKRQGARARSRIRKCGRGLRLLCSPLLWRRSRPRASLTGATRRVASCSRMA